MQQPRKSVHWNARQNPIGNTSSENMVMSSLPVKQALHLWNHLTIHIVFLSIMIVMHSWERTSHKESDDKINQNWPRPKDIPAINNCCSCIMIINGFYSLSGLRLYISSSQMHSRPPDALPHQHALVPFQFLLAHCCQTQVSGLCPSIPER